ncbi:hypothetical protein L6164_015596 [Bauhinia variegata]|uniref:Uncharacterized protein n=1 Tax=Bauhinia variegata TaxID=167791 RepID=A0ACB9NL52_BAUVA|nr:hypothetical protein L6164_015596 [Bauhinia variegata]
MSNLTSASSEISASAGPKNYPQHSSTSTNQASEPKKKRNLPGNPDPDAEVIALSPKSLLATNRFICEICNKGFKRDQNLQLHRRGHNLPWKLKQRTNKETLRKKVYVCPEPTCVHHDPSRALGDLTGIKKHFCRKHGEKKWRCEKCSKRYAVQSDWKAHSKICGTREYKCDCGTIFSRRDSFITHRAFCDALAQESARAIAAVNPLLSSQTQLHSHSHSLQPPSVKKGRDFNLRPENIPPWLACPQVGEAAGSGTPLRSSDFSSGLLQTPLEQSLIHQENPNPSTSMPSFQSPTTPHMSATALLQKASQIGVTMSNTSTSPAMLRPYHQAHVSESCSAGAAYSSLSMHPSSAVSALVKCSREEIGIGFTHHGLPVYGAGITSGCLEEGIATANAGAEAAPSSFFYDMMGPVGSASGFEDALRGMLNPTKDGNFHELLSKPTEPRLGNNHKGAPGGASDEMTKDFLGLKAFSQRGIFSLSGFDHLGSSSFGKQNQNQTPLQD